MTGAVKSIFYILKSLLVLSRPVHSLRISGWPSIKARLNVGRNVIINSSRGRVTKLVGKGRIEVGNDCLINVGACIFATELIQIGNNVAIADEAYIIDSNSHGIAGEPVITAPIIIEDGAWICARSIILPGVRIGRMSVVAAGSVVVRDVPSETIVAGNPARVIRHLSYPPQVVRSWHN